MYLQYAMVFGSDMQEQGVPCVQDLEETFGAKRAEYPGPDGMTFSFGETSHG